MATAQQDIQTFDWPAFRRAYERLDTDGVRRMCADDIVYTEVDSRTPPSSPRVVEGIDALVQHVASMSGADFESRVYDEVIGDGRVAFTAECLFPGGIRVLGMVTLHVEDGLVTRMTAVQAFDEAGQ
jgi:hypothetical protein